MAEGHGMNRAECTQEASHDFKEVRTEVSQKLFTDPSYTSFDAMAEMSTGADEHITHLSSRYPGIKLWVAGSLGRREMLPNSDIDLFVVFDDEVYEESDIRVEGVDKFEIGHISSNRLRGLLKFSIVEAHQFTDGRMAGQIPSPDVESMIFEENTPDHLLATALSEYFFYRYFDFPNKATTMGPNMKYSAGSSRESMFFNLLYRINTGILPADRGSEPELTVAIADAETRYDIRAPYDAINMLFTVKNAAISVYDRDDDMRSRFVSPESLAAIYEFCKSKFQVWGIKNERQFIDTYSTARRELEATIDRMIGQMLFSHPASEPVNNILQASTEELPGLCLQSIMDESEYAHSLITLGAWRATTSQITSDNIEKITQKLIELPLDRSWGALMAVVCCPDISDTRLSSLADWLYENEKGAYLMKLVTRNTNASVKTRTKALEYYKEKQFIV